MISIVYYGRNDGHGYNLHKRFALGINCAAAALDAPGDEIIFVDYNSDDSLPTLPEAVADTLTPAARRLLRVIRVRPVFHRRYAARSHLPVLEPIARNIAIRRANPANHWVLSSNPDMILAPCDGRSLSAIARDLPDGLYHVPRFELPEAVWETFDRAAPAAAAAAARHWGAAVHLNEIVRCDVVGFDAVGDFQLMPRAEVHRIHGFHEGMLLGWHQDSNLAKRFHLRHGAVRDLAAAVEGYHCDHTRLATATHRPDPVRNSWFQAFDGVSRDDLPEQAESWGAPDETFEEFRLESARSFAFPQVLAGALGAPAAAPYEAMRNPSSHGKAAGDPRHVLPYIANALATAPRSHSAAWIGADPALFRLFRDTWPALGFATPIYVPEEMAGLLGDAVAPPARTFSLEALLAASDVLLFDFAAPSGTAVERAFAAAVAAERRRIADGALPRYFVCANAVHNDYEAMVVGSLETVPTPFSARTRHGVVRADPRRQWDWTMRLETGRAGLRRSGVISAPAGIAGTVAFGPHAWLPEGRYRARIAMTLGPLERVQRWAGWLWQIGQVAHIKIVASGRTLARRTVFGGRARAAEIELPFEVENGAAALGGVGNVEVWLWTHGLVAMEVSAVVIDRLDSADRSVGG
ncbi:MAG: hypothetical protein KIT16_05335 [Rhodospirillaceae bacterium]|nr:hypothetical protein [Rhodospirillaceae bacterium]